MSRIVANFHVDLSALPGRMRAYRPLDQPASFRLELSGWDVQGSLAESWGGRLYEKGDTIPHFSFGSLMVQMSKETAEEPPLDSEAGESRLREIESECWELLTTVVHRIVAFFKFELRNPLLRQVGQSEIIEVSRDSRIEWTGSDGNTVGIRVTQMVVVRGLSIGLERHLGMQPLTMALDSSLQTYLEGQPRQPELYEEILSDAQAAMAEKHYRRGIMELAVACEVLIKRHFFGSSVVAGAVFGWLEDGQRIRASVLELVDGPADRAFNESFRKTHPQEYMQLDHLFRCRNKVAHGGPVVYRDDSGREHRPDLAEIEQWWDAVAVLASWLKHKT